MRARSAIPMVVIMMSTMGAGLAFQRSALRLMGRWEPYGWDKNPQNNCGYEYKGYLWY